MDGILIILIFAVLWLHILENNFESITLLSPRWLVVAVLSFVGMFIYDHRLSPPYELKANCDYDAKHNILIINNHTSFHITGWLAESSETESDKMSNQFTIQDYSKSSNINVETIYSPNSRKRKHAKLKLRFDHCHEVELSGEQVFFTEDSESTIVSDKFASIKIECFRLFKRHRPNAEDGTHIIFYCLYSANAQLDEIYF